MRYYVLVIEGGTEISHDGPYISPDERDTIARSIWRDVRPHGNVFRAQINRATGEMSVGTFTEDELDA